MAVSSNYSRSVLGEDCSRTVLGGSDVNYTRSVLGGSDGSDENYSRSVLGGSDVDYTRSVLGGSDEDYSRSVLGGSDVDYTRSVLGVSTIDVSTSNDNMPPSIYELTVVQTHYCVVLDMNNKSVKVVDTRTGCVTSQIQLSDADNVCSITSVNDDQVAVLVRIKVIRIGIKFLFFRTYTTEYAGEILLFSVSASGIISDTHKSIYVGYAYNGITHSNDRFYAAISSQIDVISMQGQIITTFTNKSFSSLCGIALSNDHNTLYVCSFHNDTVFSVDLNGNVTASYKDNDLKYPRSITVDSDGYVYVCSYVTRCVHQLTADLNKVQVIIKDIIVLRCVFNKNDNSLYLDSDNEIKVYNLSYR